ncbi:hypothetical protein EBT16_11220, partial [bacterium]|nr:hypothetical protein [bacterium]
AGNPDNDALTNAEELAAGTHPNVSNTPVNGGSGEGTIRIGQFMDWKHTDLLALDEYNEGGSQGADVYRVANNKFDVAQSFVQGQAAQLVQWMEEDWKKRGMKMPALKPEETKEVQERAERMVRSSLLLREVAVKEEIKLDPERLKQRIELVSTQLGRTPEETEKLLSGKDMLDRIKDEILTDQVFDFLLSQAKIRN